MTCRFRIYIKPVIIITVYRIKFKPYFIFFFLFFSSNTWIQSQTLPDHITFVRQGVQRMLFDEEQSIRLAKLDPKKTIGISAMHPATHYFKNESNIAIKNSKLIVESALNTQTSIWFGGFNPFATYTIDLNSLIGEGDIGFEFSEASKKEQVFITVHFEDTTLIDVNLKVIRDLQIVADQSIRVNQQDSLKIKGRLILQMLGSGLVLYLQDEEIPKVIGQCDFNTFIDLREKQRIHAFQSQLFIGLQKGKVMINGVDMALTAGVGLADIRPITYENGDLYFDNGRVWYTMSIRGRALPHHIQGVFSMNPTVFDIKLEGVILFDRNDGLLRNEIASHIFYDRKNRVWRGITTGFSAFANPDQERKQLLAVESLQDPRFGFSVMNATPFGIVGDIEDPHILFDEEDKKWRILTCENHEGYKAVILESDSWNKDYKKTAGPVEHNSTGTSIQKIDGQYYCFSGSSDRKVYIYSYPDLKEAGILKMDLPPWSETSGTRTWPNVVQLPTGYPFRFIALMMDRFNYPDLNGPNWSYGALYLYHGY